MELVSKIEIKIQQKKGSYGHFGLRVGTMWLYRQWHSQGWVKVGLVHPNPSEGLLKTIVHHLRVCWLHYVAIWPSAKGGNMILVPVGVRWVVFHAERFVVIPVIIHSMQNPFLTPTSNTTLCCTTLPQYSTSICMLSLRYCHTVSC